MSNFNNDLTPYDLDEVWAEADSHEEWFTLATGDESINVGIHENNLYEFEVYVESKRTGLVYFADFSDLTAFMLHSYPEADWEIR